VPRIEFAAEFDRAEQHAATAADFTWVQDLGIAGFPTCWPSAMANWRC
jgi:putative protein-disulfide isomerase